MRFTLDVLCFTTGIGLPLLLALYIVPILVAVEGSKDNLMAAFMSLPGPVTAHLLAAAERHKKSIRLCVDDGDDGDAAGDDTDDEDEGGSPVDHHLLALGPYAESSDGNSGEGEVDWTRVYQVHVVMQARAARSQARRSRLLLQRAKSPGGTDAGSASAFTPASAWARLRACLRRRKTAGANLPSPAGATAPATAPGSAVPPTRVYRKSLTSPMLMALYLLPLVFVLAWFLNLRAWAVDTLTTVEALSGFAAMSVSRDGATRRVVMSTLQHMMTVGFPVEQDRSYTAVLGSMRGLRNTQSILAYGKPAGLLPTDTDANIPWLPRSLLGIPGDETGGILALGPEQMAQVSLWSAGNLCTSIAKLADGKIDEGRPLNVSLCSSFRDGLFFNGAAQVLREVLASALVLVQRRSRSYIDPVTGADVGNGTTYDTSVPTGIGAAAPSPLASRPPAVVASSNAVLSDLLSDPSSAVWSTPYSLTNEVKSEEMAVLTTGVDHGILGLRYLTKTYTDAAAARVEAFTGQLWLYLGVSLGVFVATMLAFWISSVMALQREIYEKQTLLLLLPSEVCARTPAVMTIVAGVLAQIEAESSSGVSGGSSLSAKLGDNGTGRGAPADAGGDTAPGAEGM